MLKVINYTDLNYIIKAIVSPNYENGLALPRDIKIYDMGCGTGMVGKSLKEYGYVDIVGSDESETFV